MPGFIDQETFNQVRESRIIEALQAVARSPVGGALAFKGGTALRLFWDLPRYSEDLDFVRTGSAAPEAVLKAFTSAAEERGWEVTDAAVKKQTVLCEYRFRWEGPNFHLKLEASMRPGRRPVEVRGLRGVPVVVLREDALSAEKLLAFLDRDAARDAYDLWFILDRRLKVDAAALRKACGSAAAYYRRAIQKAGRLRPRRLANDVGKLVDARGREWLRTTFRDDLLRLLHRGLRGP